MQGPKTKKKVGLSRRELEWALGSLMHNLPSDPKELARHLAGVIVSLIDQNNTAIANALPAAREPEESEPS
jgi:hypothetical protein